jgi:Ca2+/Na+ antiporter
MEGELATNLLFWIVVFFLVIAVFVLLAVWGGDFVINALKTLIHIP